MKALLLGGNGFIGSHLTDKLIEAGWDVVVIDQLERLYDQVPQQVQFIKGDFTQPDCVKKALIGVDIVFHLAWASIHEVSNKDPIADVRANLIPTIQLLEACNQVGVQKVIFLSSGGTVYGPSKQLPIPESHQNDPVTSYGITKLAVEKYLRMFEYLYGLNYVVLRPSVPYGPRQNPLGRQGAVAVFLYRVGNDLPVTIWGDGSTTRDFFYISDLVDALVVCAERENLKNRVYNIGGGEEISLIDLVSVVQDTIGKDAIINYHHPRKFDASRIVLDTRLANQELDWSPRVPLTEGVAKTWSWLSRRIIKGIEQPTFE